MKRFFIILLTLLMVALMCSCGAKTENTTTTAPEADTTDTVEKNPADRFVGKWINADSAAKELKFELKEDGTAVYEGKTEGTWALKEGTEEITITMTIDDEKRSMDGYFIIAMDNYVCRATPENQHYLDDGEGVLELEVMLTENTCVDCVKE